MKTIATLVVGDRFEVVGVDGAWTVVERDGDQVCAEHATRGGCWFWNDEEVR